MRQIFEANKWGDPFDAATQQNALHALENGQILYFPRLAFALSAQEQLFLSPHYVDKRAKNMSYHAQQKKLWGVQKLTDGQHAELKSLLDRFACHATNLVHHLLPAYTAHLTMARTSLRPVQVSHRKTSYRKDDKRLHVDAFPSAPNQGKRILRVFCNINPHGEDRVWRVGEPFEQVAQAFLPQIGRPLPLTRALLRFLKITKSYRTLYDHYMLQLHDRMKKDERYQREANQQTLRFPPGSTWIVQTDHVSHAALSGQHMLEQTFYLPVRAMQNEALAPVRILERLLQRALV